VEEVKHLATNPACLFGLIIALLQQIANLPHLAIPPSPPPEESPMHLVRESPARTLLREKEVAGQLQVSVGVLHKWRRLGTGPNFVKIGRVVRYRQSAVDDWIGKQCGGT
jgi:predicted DNA-binding transcriptional regulator AlpA